MKLLLDTHCWLWLQVEPERFPEPASTYLTDPNHDLYLSAASAWEIAIKWSIGRLPLPQPPTDYVPDRMERHGVLELPIRHRHVLRVASLPLHHRDPLDRLLIAQAQLEDCVLLSADAKIAAYDGFELLQA